MSDVVVRELTPTELPLAAMVLGRGLRDNPLHVRVAGPDRTRRETIFAGIFGTVLSIVQSKGAVLGAWSGTTLVGVCAFVPPGKCQPTLTEKLRLLRAVMSHSSIGASLKVKRWLDTWTKHDPEDKTHWHIGPFAVDPAWQRRGAGTALLKMACGKIDEQNGVAYLETDTNVVIPLYEKFAFKTVGGADVIGVPNWFLLRPSRADSARWARPPSAPQFVLPKSNAAATVELRPIRSRSSPPMASDSRPPVPPPGVPPA